MQWTTIWINLKFLAPTFFKCFQTVFTMEFDNETNSFRDRSGVEIRIFDFGLFDGLLWEYLELEEFQLYFQQMGYSNGVNLHGAPYDFRRAVTMISDFTKNLTSVIEKTFLSNGNKRVYLISHSTGGSMTLYFLNQQTQQWKDKYVAGWISLSGNLAGEIDNLPNVINGFLPLVFSQAARTWDFYAWRLPEPIVYGNKIIVSTSSKQYSSFNMSTLLTDMGAVELALVYPHLSTVLASLDPPNVNTWCFYGANLSTPIGYVYANGLNEKPTSIINGMGDGEQDDLTNMSCEKWKETMDKKYEFAMQGFNGVKHTKLPADRNILETISAIIRRNG
ncbi:unnamed protein product [Didymodactylos carnosus]|uniref:Uncharacterized protein n=1 Tax=Didymodactylos carnosus TaxID=1234261 RepID=A0A816E5H9_9BILA|nr:unnamed protein product [Didymodactylos carnosus]CAF1641685.1 unnamed protein product [Didymodactylos carnosus]CAF3705494.1 unnamed protein product [Didymodactylos carnosus]CAF4554379.1 unnamed protein product [Didymodactylos carnosus]